MFYRAGVLGLMLHSTYNHEVMERITKANENGKLKEGSWHKANPQIRITSNSVHNKKNK